MASGTISYNPQQYVHVTGSWSTSDIGNAIKVSFNMALKNEYNVQVSANPKLLLYGIPGKAFAGDVTDLSGQKMVDFVNDNGGACSLKDLGNGTILPGTMHSINTSFNIAKEPSARNVTLYFGSAVQSTYFWSMLAGEVSATISIPSSYTAPKKFSISVNSKTSTSVTVKASWTEGSKTSTVTASIGSSSVNISNGGTGTISGLTPNTSYSISGSLSDGTTSLSSSASVLTDIVGPSAWSSASSNTNSITVAATSSNGGNFKYQYRIQKSGSWSSWQDSGTFGSLSANTNYPLEARCVNTDNSTTSSSLSGSLWTYPVVNVPSLSRRSGSEHNTIDVSTSASVASSYDQFAFKLGNGGWSGWQTAKTYAYGSLSGNTLYTVYVKMKNTSSGYESSAQSASITTWHNPLTNLKVNLVNRWFWYLQTDCSYTYTGTISKFEFDIGGQGWQNKGTTNSHSRGSTTAGTSGNLAYNTDHVCKVRVTDNHGRTYTAQATYKTLDERCLYVNGALREVKVIKPNNSVVYITPNLLTVVKPDGSTVNMNKIINNDDRTSY